MFSIIDWQTDPHADLAMVRIHGDRVSKGAHPVGPADLHREEVVACFRCEELRPIAKLDNLLDATLLARIVLPTADRHDLPSLAAHFSIAAEWADATARASAAAQVWQALMKKLIEQPLSVLDEMVRLLKPTRNPLYDLIEAAAKQALRKGFGKGKRGLTDLLPEGQPWAAHAKRPPPKEPPALLDVQTLCDAFGSDGVLAERFTEYEHRPEQIRMVREVCEAFNDALILMVEAGTGTGKSLAYLVPAVLWAVKNEDPVVVSTNTKNLQSQLFRSDLPFLEKALGGAFRYALIKGRANYLCVRKLLRVLNAAEQELSVQERFEILPILTWLAVTDTGDVAENSGFKPGMESDLWARLSTRPDECMGPRCRWARRCFVRRARAQALQADIVVANHATVFSEAGLQNMVLPPYRCVIFDEAHNVENVVTDCFAVTVAPWQIPRVLNRLFRGRRDGAGRGLFSSLRFQMSRAAGLPEKRTRAISELIEQSITLFPEIRQASESLFDTVAMLFAGARPGGDRIRYGAERRPHNWPPVAHAVTELAGHLVGLAERLEQIHKQVISGSKGKEKTEPYATFLELAADIGSQALRLRGIHQSLETVLNAKDPAYVYWAQAGARQNDRALCAAPLDIGGLMEEAVYSRARTVVFTSATLASEGRFDFMLDRLGLHGTAAGRLRAVDLGSSFDFSRQVLLAVPTFLPEPRAKGIDFVKPFCDLAVDMLRATSGRGLVLFTSHAMLRASQGIIKSALAEDGIRVLAQGVDGERTRLAALFAKDTSSVLLGTQSFWEGMDVPGESLSCLILAKLPFRPHTDPIVSARCDLLKSQDRNAFTDYMIPDAVLRLKQGFGRLIRTHKDCGVVVVCDSRMVTKAYGRAFRASLPTRTRVFRNSESLLSAAGGFLTSQPALPGPTSGR